MSSAVRTDVESFQLIQGLTSHHLYYDMTMDIDDLESLTTEVSVDEVSSLGAQITDVDFFGPSTITQASASKSSDLPQSNKILSRSFDNPPDGIKPNIAL